MKRQLKHEYIIIIPARYGSTRFPGKPLARLGGTEIIVRVCRNMEKTGIRTVVATDDLRIKECVERSGFEAVMTSSSHSSGTERIMEAFRSLGSPADVVINVQGDEPFVTARQVGELVELFEENEDCEIATLVRKFDKKEGFEALFDPNVVKVTFSFCGEAICFSRSIIPYVRDADWREWTDVCTFHTHVGVYGFRTATLGEVTSLPRSPLEMAEKLEQLRWLDNGYRVHVAQTDMDAVGIDTPEDLEKASRLLS